MAGIATVHSIVFRDTVTSLPAGSVTRGIHRRRWAPSEARSTRVTWFTGATVLEEEAECRSKINFASNRTYCLFALGSCRRFLNRKEGRA